MACGGIVCGGDGDARGPDAEADEAARLEEQEVRQPVEGPGESITRLGLELSRGPASQIKTLEEPVARAPAHINEMAMEQAKQRSAGGACVRPIRRARD
jgi:hypothetical protein